VFIQASDSGHISLYVRSILWDMGVPQNAATILYKDNDGVTAMANAGKPTPRSRHIDIKYYALQEWVERDLLVLQRIDTSINMLDHFTKPLGRILFYCHCDWYMGHVPPTYSPNPKYNNFFRKYTISPAQSLPTLPANSGPLTAAAAHSSSLGYCFAFYVSDAYFWVLL
jgi:hypothetical protein